MNNELKALKEDYNKLLIQVQSELLEKNHYKKQCEMAHRMMLLKDEKIERLSLALSKTAKEL